MALHTRRRLLQAATALAAGLAGCGGSGSDSQSRTVAAGGAEPPASSVTDPPQLVARGGTERPPIQLADADDETTDEEPEPMRFRTAHSVVDDPETAERLTVADDVEVDDDLAAFVEETAFGSETLYVETNAVRECFELALCWVSWQPDEIHTDYARRLRPYDTACTADARRLESRLVRLPVALDADAVTAFGTSIGSGGCDHGGAE